jgi:hypothetical protein
MVVAPHRLAGQAGLAVLRDGIAVTRSRHKNTPIERPEIEDVPIFASSLPPFPILWEIGL